MKAGWDQAIHGNQNGVGGILLNMHGIALQGRRNPFRRCARAPHDTAIRPGRCAQKALNRRAPARA